MIMLLGYRFSLVVAATFIESIAGQNLNLDNNKNKYFQRTGRLLSQIFVCAPKATVQSNDHEIAQLFVSIIFLTKLIICHLGLKEKAQKLSLSQIRRNRNRAVESINLCSV